MPATPDDSPPATSAPADAAATESSAPRPVDAVLAAYLEAEEAGRAPRPDDLIAAHPALADDLRAFFADRGRFEREAADLGVPPPHGSTGGDPPGTAPGPGTRVGYFGEYELLEEVGRGGMGVVYRARQVRLDRVVALKMILHGWPASAADVRRFRAEAEHAARLDHPNVVAVHEVGEHAGRHYFTMRYVDGGRSVATAGDDRRPSGPKAIARFVATAARAVDHAHRRGVLHRDLKPGNVLVDAAGAPHVTDFGLSGRHGGDGGDGSAADVTVTAGGPIGTPAYMSPEQARGERPLTTAADVYGLGATLYFLLAGRPPFAAATALETLALVRDAPLAPPRRFDPAVPADLETVCVKCLAKRPDDRYATAAALADDLERFARGEPIAARPAGPLERLRLWRRRNPALAAAAGAAVVATVATVVTLAVAVVLVGRSRDAANVLAGERDEQRRIATAAATQATDGQRRAQASEADANARLAENLVYAADGLVASERYAEARATYEQGVDLARRIGAPDLPALSGLVALSIRAPMPLVGGNASGSAGGFTAGPVHGLAVSADQRLALAIAGRPDDEGAVARVYDVRTGREVARLTTTKPPLLAAGFTTDGRRALAVDAAGAAEWDLATGKPGRRWRLPPLPGPADTSLDAAAVLPGAGAALVKTSRHQLLLWNLADPARLAALDDGAAAKSGNPRAAPGSLLTFSRNGRAFLTASRSGTVTSWATATTRPIAVATDAKFRLAPPIVLDEDGQSVVDREFRSCFLGPSGELPDPRFDDQMGERGVTAMAGPPLAYAGRGRIRLAAGRDPDRFVASGRDKTPVRTIEGQGLCGDLRHLDDGRSILAAGDGLSLHRVAAETPLQDLVNFGSPPWGFSPDGRLVATIGSGPTLFLRDAATARVVLKRQLAESANRGGAGSVEWLADGRGLYCNVGLGGQFVDVSTGVVTRQVDLGRFYLSRLVGDGAVVGLEQFGGGRPSRLVLVGPDGAETPCPEAVSGAWPPLTGPTACQATGCVAFARGPSLRVWDTRANRVASLDLPGPPDRRVYDVALWFAPDGRSLVAFSTSAGRAWTVDVPAMRVTSESAPPPGGGIAAMLPDGRTAVSTAAYAEGGSDRAIELWDVPTGKSIRVLPTRERFMGTSVAVEPNGRGVLCLGYYDFTRPDAYRRFRAELPAARAALARDPEDAAALGMLGRWYAFRGMDAWAADLLERAARGGAAVPHLTLARCYWVLDRCADAVREFDAARAAGEAPAEYLRLCAAAAGSPRPPEPPEPPGPPRLTPVADRLAAPMPEVRFDGQSLDDVTQFVRDVPGASVYVNWSALAAAGVPRTRPVRLRTYGATLKDGLDALVATIPGAAWAVDGNVVVISTKADLAARPPGRLPPTGSDAKANAAAQAQMDAPVDYVVYGSRDLAGILGWAPDPSRPPPSVDWDALRAAGVDPNRLVDLRLRDVTRGDALACVLREAGGTAPLAFVIRDGQLLVSTRAAIDKLGRP